LWLGARPHGGEHLSRRASARRAGARDRTDRRGGHHPIPRATTDYAETAHLYDAVTALARELRQKSLRVLVRDRRARVVGQLHEPSANPIHDVGIRIPALVAGVR